MPGLHIGGDVHFDSDEDWSLNSTGTSGQKNQTTKKKQFKSMCYNFFQVVVLLKYSALYISYIFGRLN